MGYSPLGCKESDMSEQHTHTHTHTHTLNHLYRYIFYIDKFGMEKELWFPSVLD